MYTDSYPSGFKYLGYRRSAFKATEIATRTPSKSLSFGPISGLGDDVYGPPVPIAIGLKNLSSSTPLLVGGTIVLGLLFGSALLKKR